MINIVIECLEELFKWLNDQTIKHHYSEMASVSDAIMRVRNAGVDLFPPYWWLTNLDVWYMRSLSFSLQEDLSLPET